MTVKTPDRETYIEEHQEQLDVLKAEFADLRAKANMVDVDSKLTYTQTMRDVDHAFEHVRARLDQLKAAKGSAYDDFRSDFESAWARMNDAMQVARVRNDEYTRYN